MLQLRRQKAGYTTIELLVVMAIIGLISSITIPLLVQMGVFGGRRVELAARDLFTLMTAARSYATTNNIESAVVYSAGVELDSYTNLQVPVVNAIAVMRRVQRVDLQKRNPDPGFLALQARMGTVKRVLDNKIFVPVRAAEGNFRLFEGDTCILPDLFEVDGTSVDANSTTGLTGILVWDLESHQFMEPRSEYLVENFRGIDSTLTYSFPAHRFRPSGEVIAASDYTRQRATFRVGLLPSQEVSERFSLIPDGTANFIPIQFGVRFDTFTNVPYNTNIYKPDPDYEEFIDMDVGIELYIGQGRVKVSS